ncbi:MAG: CRISPR-associated endonuclease Cas9/Csn1 [candidate division WS6 bacterium OLB20]|uniref:CRISPR-associated endonuclease Cas9 n=1 Tax=candidate division WS6 bacterium OLB20 TaxID=1617426 RepID=A0A136LXP1_9BACT|nr:MAG: CRISPR-associated endonuclease Cas9/Csn1 [candidate division WS6 bacterium OLB20]
MVSQLSNKDLTPYQLRFEALERKLSGIELARALLHIAKRRGYKSNRRSEIEKEEGKVLEAVAENRNLMKQKGYRTVGEMLLLDDKYKERKRNSSGSYIGVTAREMLEDEARLILKRQRELGNERLTEDIQERLLGEMFFQRPFLNRSALEEKIGNCEFFAEEPRLAKNTRTAELFILYSNLNNLRLRQKGSYEDVMLSDHQRELIVAEALQKGAVKHNRIRKILSLPYDTSFKNVNYRKPKKADKNVTWEQVADDSEKQGFFVNLKGVAAIQKALKKTDPVLLERINQDTELADSLVEVLVFNKDEDAIISELTRLFPDIKDDALKELSAIAELKGFLHLSKKALNLIVPELKSGMVYSDAVTKAIPEEIRIKNGLQQKYLPPIDTDNLTNFNVIRALAQTRVVVNAIIKEYGSPLKVHIEFARDVSKTHEERRAIEKQQADNRQENERIVRLLKNEFGLSDPKGKDILKYKLWTEQAYHCAYSLMPIPADKLFSDDTYTEIDHILPYSRSLDDSYFNKVLVLSSQNQNKGSKTVYEYLGTNEELWKKLMTWWQTSNMPLYKKERLMTTDFDKRDIKTFMERDMNDTRYISRYLRSFLEQHLEFKPAPFKRRIFAFQGRVTAMLRRYLGVNHLKNRDESNRHHALDAVIVAIADSSMQQRITEFFKKQEEHTQKAKDYFPEPWPYFAKDLAIRVFADSTLHNDLQSYAELHDRYKDILDQIRPILVSRKAERKLTGALHKETVMSVKDAERGKVMVKRIPITKLEQKHFDQNLIYGDDPQLVKVLKDRLEAFMWDAEAAFKEPVLKPAREGRQQNEVKRVKIIDGPASSFVQLKNDGVAAQDNMIRIDIFEDKGTYFVPIYIGELAGNLLPRKASKSGADYLEWPEMREDTFVLSIYPDDYVCLTGKDKIIEGYYVKADRATASVEVRGHDNSWSKRSIGIKSMKVTKYYIDPLGRKYALSREKERKVPWRTAPST